MKNKIPIQLISWSFVIGVTFSISYWTGLNFWILLPIIAGAMLINGLVATFEDDLPGGFNNPDGTQTPRYVKITTKIIRTFLVVAGLLGIVAVGLWLRGR